MIDALQVLPALTEAEYGALRESIREHGVLVPLVYDERGDLLDGHHRLKACGELGITNFPSEIIPCADDAERRTLARSLNCQRRHLTQEQRRDLIAAQLRETPHFADNRIAVALGVDSKTVAAVRSGLEGTSEIPKLTEREGGDGKTRPARRPMVLVKDKREQKIIERDLPDALHSLASTVTDARGVTKAARRTRWHRDAEAAAGGDATIGKATLLLGDMRERGAEIPDESVDLVFTDPPYSDEAAPLWEALSELAARVLKPDGILVAYSGVGCFPWAFDGLRRHLDYWTLGTLVHSGQHNSFWKRRVFVAGKFLLFMVRPGFSRRVWIDNLAVSPQPEKDFHEWQQSIKPAQDYIRTLTSPADLVCDPFLGGGTTGVAAVELGRHFVGIEIDPAAMATAQARIAAVGEGGAR
jgi:site-specific DNA-methyltransferase (adenine-specific)